MNTECIDSIDLKTNNKDIISVLNGSFGNFYISNIDNNGDEISYEKVRFSNNLFANFFIIKLLHSDSENINDVTSRLLNRKDIVKVGITFTNGVYQEFDLAKRRVVNDGILENTYEEVFIDEEENLCILVSDKKLKYKKELFI